MKNEYVITIRSGKAGGKGGTRKADIPGGRSRSVFGRRIPATGCAPYPMWLSRFSLSESVSSRTVYFPWGPDETWWLRDGDIVLVIVRDTADYTIGSGYTKIEVGSVDVWWKRWTTGDPLSVDVSLTSPTGVSNFKGFVTSVRQCADTGSPIAASAYTSGTGTFVTFGAANTSSPDSLVFQAVWQEGTSGGQFFNLANTELDDLGVYSDVSGTDGIFIGNKSKAGSIGSTTVDTSNSSAAWKALTLALATKKTPGVALTGPVNGYSQSSNPIFAQPAPIWLEGDLVVAYRISTDVGLAPPTGWERMANTPVLQGTKYLHVYWKRWTASDGTFWNDWPSTLDWAYHVFRNAARSGDPFESVTFTTGNGTSVSGGAVSGTGKLVAFAAILDNIDNMTKQLGVISASNVTNLEVDSDPTLFQPDPNRQYQFFKTASAIANGNASFSVPILRSARDWWTVTYTVKKR